MASIELFITDLPDGLTLVPLPTRGIATPTPGHASDDPTTLAVGEEGGEDDPTTLAVGEEGEDDD
ncbi:hypothetical protein [Embleya sp. NPDC050493]|uniref:hypothetical protein n=1 Tax=Embleya sp. NPDC050493 TaxID=3363989 RepID=UPI0037AB2FA6